MAVMKQAQTALANPVFDPERQIDGRFSWWAERNISAVLTCNIGMELIRYAGGRPLWQLSLSHRNPDGSPVPVLRWSPTKWRKAEALRDRSRRLRGWAGRRKSSSGRGDRDARRPRQGAPAMSALRELREKVAAGDYDEVDRLSCGPFHEQGLCREVVGAFSGSLSDAKTLHEAMLPGW